MGLSDTLKEIEEEFAEDFVSARIQGQFSILMWLFDNGYLNEAQVRRAANENGIGLKLNSE